MTIVATSPATSEMPATTDLSNRPTVASKMPCFGCGYDLRALPLTGSCPECGRSLPQMAAAAERALPAAHRLLNAMQAQLSMLLGLLLLGVALTMVEAIGGNMETVSLALWFSWLVAEFSVALWAAIRARAVLLQLHETPAASSTIRGDVLVTVGIAALLVSLVCVCIVVPRAWTTYGDYSDDFLTFFSFVGVLGLLLRALMVAMMTDVLRQISAVLLGRRRTFQAIQMGLMVGGALAALAAFWALVVVNDSYDLFYVFDIMMLAVTLGFTAMLVGPSGLVGTLALTVGYRQDFVRVDRGTHLLQGQTPPPDLTPTVASGLANLPPSWLRAVRGGLLLAVAATMLRLGILAWMSLGISIPSHRYDNFTWTVALLGYALGAILWIGAVYLVTVSHGRLQLSAPLHLLRWLTRLVLVIWAVINMVPWQMIVRDDRQLGYEEMMIYSVGGLISEGAFLLGFLGIGLILWQYARWNTSRSLGMATLVWLVLLIVTVLPALASNVLTLITAINEMSISYSSYARLNPPPWAQTLWQFNDWLVTPTALALLVILFWTHRQFRLALREAS